MDEKRFRGCIIMELKISYIIHAPLKNSVHNGILQ